jgi:hypothetical protein
LTMLYLPRFTCACACACACARPCLLAAASGGGAERAGGGAQACPCLALPSRLCLVMRSKERVMSCVCAPVRVRV